METSPNGSKRKKDVDQSECPIPGGTGLVEALSNTDPNANWGMEPNFNLNLKQMSLSNPRSTNDARKLNGGNRKDDGSKGGGKPGVKEAGTTETSRSWSTLTTTATSPGGKDDPSRQKSKIPPLALSPKAEATNGGREQRLKSPNPKRNTMLSPKPRRMEQTPTTSSPKMAECVAVSHKTQGHRTDSASVFTPKPHITMKAEPATKTSASSSVSPRMHANRNENSVKETQSPRTIHSPVSPKTLSQRGGLDITSPKLTEPTTTTSKRQNHGTDQRTAIPKTIKSSERVGHDAMTCSLSPKPSTQRQAARLKDKEKSIGLASKENLDCKDSKAGPDSKTDSKGSSTSKAQMGSKDSLDSKTGSDSKASSSSKAQMGSKDSLDSKTGSDSKASSISKAQMGSKDSLDSKTGSGSKASSNSKAQMGSKDSLDSKTGSDSKASSSSKAQMGSKDSLDSKTGSDSKASSSSKAQKGSKDSLDSKTGSDSKASFIPKTGPDSKPGPVCSDLNSGSDSKAIPSSKPGSRTDLVGSLPPSSFSRPNLAIAGPAGSDSSKFPVRSSSKSPLVEAPSSSSLSPRPGSATGTPGSGPSNSVGSSPIGSSRDIQKSPGSAQGSGGIMDQLAPLATSSPKTRTTVALTTTGGTTSVPLAVGPVSMETIPSSAPHNNNLTRGLTFDITKTGAVVKEDNSKLTESKMSATGGPMVSQGAVRGGDVCRQGNGCKPDNAGEDTRTPDALQSKPCHLGDTNAIAAPNIPSSAERRKDERKKEDKSKPKDHLGSSPSLSPSPHSPSSPLPPPSIHPGSSRRVREAATMTDPSERLRLRGAERREVGVQAEVEVVERSASTSPSLLRDTLTDGLTTAGFTSSLIGSPSCQSGSLTSPTAPSPLCLPIGQPSFQHVCKIDIEMHSQSALPSAVTDTAVSIPASLHTYSFDHNPALSLGPILGQMQDRDMSFESIWEEGEEERENTKREKGREEEEEEKEQVRQKGMEKPQEVEWDEEGMTWEVYGAAVDLESLGTTIQSHLQSKIKEQEERIGTLRRSFCSTGSLKGKMMKRRRKRTGGILGCCGKAPAVAD